MQQIPTVSSIIFFVLQAVDMRCNAAYYRKDEIADLVGQREIYTMTALVLQEV